jgi:hypothetical protein
MQKREEKIEGLVEDGDVCLSHEESYTCRGADVIHTCEVELGQGG